MTPFVLIIFSPLLAGWPSWLAGLPGLPAGPVQRLLRIRPASFDKIKVITDLGDVTSVETKLRYCSYLNL